MIVSEVEFIELYIDQPLFGDVSSFLKDQDLYFINFWIRTRSLKPIILNENKILELNFWQMHYLFVIF